MTSRQPGPQVTPKILSKKQTRDILTPVQTLPAKRNLLWEDYPCRQNLQNHSYFANLIERILFVYIFVVCNEASLFEWWLNSSSSWGIWFWLFSSVWKPMMTHWLGPTTGHESLMNHLVWILPIGVSMDPASREHWIYGSSTWRGPLNSSTYTWIRPSWPICALCSDVQWE